ncbi:hypothetical protein [Nocardia sp. NPDC052566]|uniref:hypothetical protein n=1 Tax=Nocardia sp. NPDC052566 TaxID=3364330 RepID=UPI0037C62369
MDGEVDGAADGAVDGAVEGTEESVGGWAMAPELVAKTIADIAIAAVAAKRVVLRFIEFISK